MSFNLADIFETVAAAVPERTALTCEGEHLTYETLNRKANQVAHLFTDNGMRAGEHAALFLRNSVEHVLSILGLIKIGCSPINVNYRYTAAELLYIFENADATAILVEELDDQDRLAEIIDDLPVLKTVFVVGEAVGNGLATAASAAGVDVVLFDPEGHSAEQNFTPRSGDALYLLYTGGTTGFPKGVMWRHDDFFHRPLSGGNPWGEARKSLEEIAAASQQSAELSVLVVAPLIHGSALYAMFSLFLQGGRVVLLRSFDAEKLVWTIGYEKVNVVTIVGDAMGSPLAEAMSKLQSDVDLSPLVAVTSGGAVWSQGVRARILAVKPELALIDSFGASESGNDGQMTLRPDGSLAMSPSPSVSVLGDDLEPLAPGSTTVGMIVRVGNLPLGYYKDKHKTDRTFRTLADGRRVAVLGDAGIVESDGTIVFLGRGSQCINTGGEKVYVEEVEACLHSHPAVTDAVVVGVPDPRLGQTVAAVVSLRPDFPPVGLPQLQEHCRQSLAGYKVPRRLAVVPTVQRSPAGKADYKWAESIFGESDVAVGT
ncbi:AMP-binding protein [Mycolicibacterium stellerae]|uniref:AMP-binding protein n=1 Tax=Mycolicibacterium stellerae TaxID=2358193 RepID=UPI000F0B4E35|nr:AMP-binding protein [Mycolicibacterium stellerae]